MLQTAKAFMDESPIRFNCIEWLPFSKKDRVCILGELCTSIKTALERSVSSVVYEILEETYDFIILYHCMLSQELLETCQKSIKETGRVVILQKNRYGVTVLAGGDFDLTALTKERNTDTLEDLQRLLIQSGVSSFHRYYPYPDSMFATTIFSDDRLPMEGECNHNIRNMNQDRLVLLDEQMLYQKAILEGKFPELSNEFIVVIGEKPSVDFVRYSNDRAVDYQIKTEIFTVENGTRMVSKKALDERGRAHVAHMASAYEALVHTYEKPGLSFVPCNLEQDGSVVFPFVQGLSLADHISSLLQDGQIQAVLDLVKEFLLRIEQNATQEISNRDFIFSNILLGEDTWYVIDYEWIESKKISTKELGFRAIYCYHLEHPEFPYEEALHILGIAESEAKELEEQEVLFQKNVTNGALSFASYRESFGVNAYTTEDIKRAFLLKEPEKKVQIYYDYGEGFSEKNSMFLYGCLTSSHDMSVRVLLPQGCKRLRIDPCEEPCIVKMNQVLLADEEVQWEKYIQINGTKCQSRFTKHDSKYPEYVFATMDPNIEILISECDTSIEHTIHIHMEIHAISMEMAVSLSKQLRKII